MGLFFNNYSRNLMIEADVDGQPAGDDNATTDYTAAGNTDTGDQQDAATDTNTTQDTDTNNDEQQNDNTDNDSATDDAGTGDTGEEETTDYTAAGGDDGTTDDSANADTGASDSGTGEESNSEVDDLKKQEEEMYNSLTPEQLDIKHKELKTRFLDMYDMILTAADRIGDVVVAEEDIGVMEYVSTNLFSLKDMISDYINSVYQTKSYMENSINYNRFIAVLNGLCKVLEEMNAKNAQN